MRSLSSSAPISLLPPIGCFSTTNISILLLPLPSPPPPVLSPSFNFRAPLSTTISVLLGGNEYFRGREGGLLMTRPGGEAPTVSSFLD